MVVIIVSLLVILLLPFKVLRTYNFAMGGNMAFLPICCQVL